MGFPLLFDEDTERELARLCADGGHDVERVVAVESLGQGATDAEVRTYARNAGRIVVTHDDDFLVPDASAHAGVFFAPDQRLSSFRHYRIIAAVSEAYPSRDDLPPVVFLTEEWL